MCQRYDARFFGFGSWELHGRSTHLEFRMPNPELVVTDHIAKLASAVGHFFRAAVSSQCSGCRHKCVITVLPSYDRQ
jgi:hypothetical protein